MGIGTQAQQSVGRCIEAEGCEGHSCVSWEPTKWQTLSVLSTGYRGLVLPSFTVWPRGPPGLAVSKQACVTACMWGMEVEQRAGVAPWEPAASRPFKGGNVLLAPWVMTTYRGLMCFRSPCKFVEGGVSGGRLGTGRVVGRVTCVGTALRWGATWAGVGVAGAVVSWSVGPPLPSASGVASGLPRGCWLLVVVWWF